MIYESSQTDCSSASLSSCLVEFLFHFLKDERLMRLHHSTNITRRRIYVMSALNTIGFLSQLILNGPTIVVAHSRLNKIENLLCAPSFNALLLQPKIKLK